ncbi:MAG: hypothetical protein GY874_19400 [Desulfobacteraceae bacterium]|nr:hypothetical protein [Desulfobacteraceae bacterium]
MRGMVTFSITQNKIIPDNTVGAELNNALNLSKLEAIGLGKIFVQSRQNTKNKTNDQGNFWLNLKGIHADQSVDKSARVRIGPK